MTRESGLPGGVTGAHVPEARLIVHGSLQNPCHPLSRAFTPLPQPSVILGLTFSFSSENKTLCFLILKVTSVYQGNYPVWRVILSYDKGRFSPCFPLWPFYGEHFPWCPCPTLPPSSLYFLPPHLKSYLQVPLAGICVLRLSKPRCHC